MSNSLLVKLAIAQLCVTRLLIAIYQCCLDLARWVGMLGFAKLQQNSIEFSRKHPNFLTVWCKERPFINQMKMPGTWTLPWGIPVVMSFWLDGPSITTDVLFDARHGSDQHSAFALMPIDFSFTRIVDAIPIICFIGAKINHSQIIFGFQLCGPCLDLPPPFNSALLFAFKYSKRAKHQSDLLVVTA